MRKSAMRPGLLLAAVLLSAVPASAAFDIDYKLDDKYAPGIGIEKPTAGKDFGDNVVMYLRVLPNKKKGEHRVFPAFINTHNYLTCPDSDKHTPVNDIKQVSYERRSGIKVLGFFFPDPGCEKPTFHLEPILAE